MEKDSKGVELNWRPDELMKFKKWKLRKVHLQARFNGSHFETKDINTNFSSAASPLDTQANLSYSVSKKRKNPFTKNEQNKKSKDQYLSLDTDSPDSTFELLNRSSSYKKDKSKLNDIIESAISGKKPVAVQLIEEPKGKKFMPIDWTLKTKMRVMSPKPFSWKGKLKASEEASGTTGYVRCLDIGEQETTLDTSPNARFHQCCLVWQHPSIPWMDLFPRSQAKLNVSSNYFVAMNQNMKEALYKDWCSSFRSLFHLLRVRQCPYFYVCGNNFTVLFRAAGICGISEVQALLTPTTRGLREALNNEEIQFTMPLKPKVKANAEENHISAEEEHNSQWMKEVGIDESEIRRISNSQMKVQTNRECDGDNSFESLVFVTGVEAQALFNFLINCKTIITTCGSYSGVPPTLLAPVAFHSATLKPLKVRESVVCNGTEKFHSLEITGPILPDILPSLCALMTGDHLEKFSVTCAQLTNTKAFTIAKHGTEIKIDSNDNKKEKIPQNVFGLENLTDCGFNKRVLEHFCSPDPERIQNFESLTYDNKLYTWS
ncbi:protein downstream neighbor of son homolog [Phymastichus coffea]|uniref:protein downstream neighbor of son homolog n=1 Tax=Phymastichus coffea TaxID=108790 RepID=UPI00273B437C|nr:protein downstream neighbor of son homolog [Phymastichus coffea]